MKKTCYQIKYRKLKDRTGKWFVKCTCLDKLAAERFIDVLNRVSDTYAELKIEPIQIETDVK